MEDEEELPGCKSTLNRTTIRQMIWLVGAQPFGQRGQRTHALPPPSIREYFHSHVSDRWSGFDAMRGSAGGEIRRQQLEDPSPARRREAQIFCKSPN
jgi:hypothetical protein